jgi:hypothetical protein
MEWKKANWQSYEVAEDAPKRTMSRQVRIFRIFLPPPYNVVLEHFLLFQFPYSPPLLYIEG